MDAVSACFAGAGRADRVHVEAFVPAAGMPPPASSAPPRPESRAGRRGAGRPESASPPVAAPCPTTAAPCSSRPSPPGSRPATAAAWASATPAPAPLRAGAVRHTTTGELTTESGAGVQLCVNRPVGDVELDLEAAGGPLMSNAEKTTHATASASPPVLTAAGDAPVATAPAAVAPTFPGGAAAASGLDEERLAALAADFDAIRAEVAADLGAADVEHIRRVIRLQRGLEVTGRASLFLGLLPPFWLLGASSLALAKILDNMEIGHNVMHGQYEWTGDPALGRPASSGTRCALSDQWRHSHNVVHHTWTNVVGKDRDVGYGVLRMSDDQEWKPLHLG